MIWYLLLIAGLYVVYIIGKRVFFVWQVIRQVKQMQQQMQKDQQGQKEKKRPETGDLIACPKCGVYVSPVSASDCGRDACPYSEK